MNIFFLDDCPTKAAQSLIDVHVSKMIIESSQILANCFSLEELCSAPKTQKNTNRRYSYWNHPCSVWVRESVHNFNWLLGHAKALVDEKFHRTTELHFTWEFIDWCHTPKLPNIPMTKPALAIKNYPDLGDTILTYRNYYSNDKRTDKNGKRIDIYTRRSRPTWFPE